MALTYPIFTSTLKNLFDIFIWKYNDYQYTRGNMSKFFIKNLGCFGLKTIWVAEDKAKLCIVYSYGNADISKEIYDNETDGFQTYQGFDYYIAMNRVNIAMQKLMKQINKEKYKTIHSIEIIFDSDPPTKDWDSAIPWKIEFKPTFIDI